MLLGVLQALGYALADGDRWHHHDELAPAVQTIELEHRLCVDVSLAGARLHFDVQLAGSHATEKLLRLGDLVASLHRAHVCQYFGARKRDGRIGIALGALVSEIDLALRALGLAAQIAQVDGGALVGLPLEDRGHRVCGVGLVLLYFELELHIDALNHLGNGVGAVGAEQLLVIRMRGVVGHG